MGTRFIGIISILILSVLIGGCKKSDSAASEEETIEDAINNTFESVVSEAYSSGSAVSGYPTFIPADFQPMTGAGDPCSFSTHRSACSTESGTGDKIKTIDWNDCAIGSSGATMSGIIREEFTGYGAAICSLTQGDSDPAMASTITRKITTDRVVTLATGGTITQDMEPDTAFDGTTFGSASTGTTIRRYDANFTDSNSISHTCGSSTNSCFRTVINGLETKKRGPRGRLWFHHILTSDLTLKGDRASGNLAINGMATIWHQISEYKSVQTFSNVTWGSTSCCFPTSGTITSVLTGTLSGTASLAFSTTCGSATLTNTNSETSTVTLDPAQCMR